jgi:hypothetical protein
MVVERDVHVRVVREVRRDVAGAELDLAVLDVLGVDELDVVEHAEVLEEGGTHEPVEITARHESEALCLKLGHGDSIGTAALGIEPPGSVSGHDSMASHARRGARDARGVRRW